MTDPTVLELSVQVPGTVDEVWRAVATGPGMTSWYVPSTVEEREGGATTSRFGEGDEMLIPGRAVVWDPPRRVCFDGGEEGIAHGMTMTFDWHVEPGDDGTQTVRFIQSGFDPSPEGQAMRAAMAAGWSLFLQNLQLHLEHFSGRDGLPMLPSATGNGTLADTWQRLTAAIGIPATPAVGDRVRAEGADAPPLAGTVVGVDPWRISLLLDEPAQGTGFIAAEGVDGQMMTSVWLYVYGDDAPQIIERDSGRWAALLAASAAG